MTTQYDPNDPERDLAEPPLWGIFRKGADYLGAFTTFDDEAKAIEHAGVLNAHSARSLSIYEARRLTWRLREEIETIHSGDAKLVWHNMAWWQNAEKIWCDHMPRPSVKHPGQISYFRNLDHAKRNVRTAIRPGRYLSRFFPDMPEKERARMARWQETGAIDNNFTDPNAYPLAIARDEDEIVNVYTGGPHSCMSHEANEFNTEGRHPAEVYATPDLGVAYLMEAATGKVRARTLVRPAKKIFGRVYPSPDYWEEDGFTSEDESRAMRDALLNRLLADGWTEDDNNGFDGARLQYIELENTGDTVTVVMPYLDKSYCVALEDDDQLFMTRHGRSYSDHVRADNTNGTLSFEMPGERCERCYDRTDNTVTVYTGHRMRGSYSWCQDCVDNHAFYCHGVGKYLTDDNDYVTIGASDYCLAYAEENFTRSDLSYEWFDGESVTVVVDDSDETWMDNEFDAHGFTCALTDTRHPNAERHPDYPAYHRDCAESDILAQIGQMKLELETTGASS